MARKSRSYKPARRKSYRPARRVRRKVGRRGNARGGYSQRSQRIVIQIVGGSAADAAGGVVADPTGETMGLVKAPSPRRARF